MARAKKWLVGTDPDSPLSAVARRALSERLETVWEYAPLAARRSREDVEYVHQLRVATRRARAALQIFASLVPKRRRLWAKKTLRGLRQAAGDARDLDVLQVRMRNLAEQRQDAQLDSVVEQITACRQSAQKPLVAVVKTAKRKGFKNRSRKLAKSVRWKSQRVEPTFREAAMVALAEPVGQFFTAAAADLSDIQVLHAMRIAGKRVRYAMELLAGAFDDSFRGELYATFAEVQEKLGTINDHATAIGTLGGWFEQSDKNGTRGALAELIAHEEKQLGATCEDFRLWWSAERITTLARQFEQRLDGRWTLAPSRASVRPASRPIATTPQTATSTPQAPTPLG
jgi:CHAD domain-containing protein